MKKVFETPTIELVAFETEDSITISAIPIIPWDPKPTVVDFSYIADIFLGL